MITTAILGYPGAGKTWSVYEFIKGLKHLGTKKIGLVEYEDFGNVVIMGRYDGSIFQGTDRLSMAVSVDFDKFFKKMVDGFSSADQFTPGPKWIIAEGDRINNSTFFHSAIKYGELERIKCDCESNLLAERRISRGHSFKASFLKTVASKVDKHVYDMILTSDQLLMYLDQFYESQIK